jgi:hypothetical protein
MPIAPSVPATRRALSSACALAQLVAIVVAVQAHAAANDLCDDATAVDTPPFDDVVLARDATIEPDEPGTPACAAAAFAHSVWYALPAGAYVVSTCGSDFDTVLQLYDGDSCDLLDRETTVCSDDADLCGPGARQSLIAFRAGDDVHVQAGSSGPAAGTLHVSIRLAPPAPNDACTAATLIRHPVFREILDVAATGADAADRGTLSSCGRAGDVRLGDAPHSVWYLYTPATSGRVTVDTTGTTTADVVAVFTERPEGCARLGARVGCGANEPVVFDGVAGTTYRVYVATTKAVVPDILVFRLTGPNAPPIAVATAVPGARVVLSAAASTDPDGDPLAFTWTQTAGPPVALSDPASAAPTFVAPASAVAFQVAVTDGAALATASVTVASAGVDADGDGVPASDDRCPATPPGAAVDVDGCACGESGHVECAASACMAGRCDAASGRCVAEPAPSGTPCADDGDPCTDDVCGGSGACTHPRAQSFRRVSCRLDAMHALVAARGASGRGRARLVRLVAAARDAIVRAATSAGAGAARRARRDLARASRGLARVIRLVVRLEARRKIASDEAGMLLDDAQAAADEVATLRKTLGAGGRRASP